MKIRSSIPLLTAVIPIFAIITGNLQARIINVPGDFELIQAAIDNSNAGDTVLVAPGRYNENINFNAHNIVVGSRFLVAGDPAFIEQTIIDGGANGRSTVSIRSGENCTLSGVTLENGQTDFGGGVYCRSSFPTLEYLLVQNNNTERSGAGIYCTQGSMPLIRNVVVRNNHAGYVAGGLGFFGGTNATIENSLIVENTCDHVGAGIQANGAIFTLDRSTVANNWAAHTGGAIYVTQGNDAVIENCILWNNLPHEIHVVPGGNDTTFFIARFCNIEGSRDEVNIWDGNASLIWGMGNIDRDPEFRDPDEGDYTLDEGSPCIDAGNPESDFDPDGTRADMGCFPFDDENGQHVINVPDDFESIQDAIDEAEEGDLVLVQPGEYRENLVIEEINLEISSRFMITGVPTDIEETIIDGNQQGSVIEIRGVDERTNMMGFTIRNGTGFLDGILRFGGGIRCLDASPRLQNLIIEENVADIAAGIEIIGGSPALTDVVIRNNIGGWGPGGLLVRAGNLTCERVIMAENQAEDDAALFIWEDANVRLLNCTITGNRSRDVDAALIGTFENCNLEFLNSILFNNNPTTILDDDPENASSIAVSYSNLEDGRQALEGFEDENIDWGDGNIDSNPFFLDGNGGDYRLTLESPCLDAGDPNSPLDPDYTRADMGALYLHHDIVRDPITVHVPGDYATIQQAIDISREGDTILVHPGTWEENLDFRGINLFVASLFHTTNDPAYIDSTVIDGGGNDVVVKYNSQEWGSSHLKGFTVTGGVGREGAGIFTFYSSPTIEYCLITGNRATITGGGVFAYQNGARFDNCTIAANTAEEEGGGFYCAGGAFTYFENSLLWGNEPQQGAFDVGAMQNSAQFEWSDMQDGIDGVRTNNNGNVTFDEDCISDDPRFVDFDGGNYRLAEGSPCIDAGDPNRDPDPDFTRADIGAFYHHQSSGAIAVSPDQLDFDQVLVDESSDLTLSVSNIGDADLTVSAVEVAGNYFAARLEEETVLQPGDTLELEVSFAPEETGDFDGTLTIFSDAINGAEWVVDLLGVGVSDPPEVISPIPDLEIEEDSDVITIADLDTVFSDPHQNGLDFEVFGNELLNLTIADGNLLTIEPADNLNGEEYLVRVRADDWMGRDAPRDRIRTLRRTDGELTTKTQSHQGSENIEIAVVAQPNLIRSLRPTETTNRRTDEQSNHDTDLPRRDAFALDEFLVTVTPVNDPPEIVVAPEELEVLEGESFEIHVGLSDVDLDWEGDELSLQLLDDHGFDTRFDQIGEDSLIFNFQTGRSEPGEYELVFEVEDSHEATARASARVTIASDNDAPVVREPIDDLEIEEDAGFVEIAFLNEVFRDPDDDPLSFEIIEAADELNAAIDEETTILSIEPDPDWSGQSEVTVRADDGQEDRRDRYPVRTLRRTDGELTTKTQRHKGFQDFEIAADAQPGLMRSLRPTEQMNRRTDEQKNHGTTALRHHGANLPRRDAFTDVSFTVTVSPVNDAPVIVDNQGNELGAWLNVQVDENQLLSVNFFSRDVDNNPDELAWRMVDPGGLPNGWTFTDNRNGTAVFRWTPNFDAARPAPYNPLFTVTDPGEGSDGIRLVITVNNVNRPPVVADPIPDRAIPEDPQPRTVIIANLPDVFGDPDPGHAEDLTFRLEQVDVPELNLEINRQEQLTASPIENFNLPNGVVVSVTAIDPEDAEVTDQFRLTVTPVNDPPDAFNLTAPADSFAIHPGAWQMFFDWEDAQDLDGDRLSYVLLIADRFNDVRDTMEIPTQESHFFIAEFDTVMKALGIWTLENEEETTFLEWWVQAHDADTMSLSVQNRHIIAPVPLSVPGLTDAQPRDWTLLPLYPNPFNPSATLRVGIPYRAGFTLSVRDITGRNLGVICSGECEPGWRNYSWSADNLPAGVYLFMLESDHARLVRKGVLLR